MNISKSPLNVLLSQTRLKTFYYARVAHDGSCVLACSNAAWLRYKLEHNFSVVAPAKVQHNKTTFHMVQQSADALTQRILHDGERHFSIYHPIDLLKKTDECVEVFSYAFDSNCADATDFYLNNTDLLLHFCRHMADFAAAPESHGHIARMQITNTKQFHLNRAYSTDVSDAIMRGHNISAREYEVITRLAKGFSYKQIASELSLSSRTVESHIDNIKRKLRCQSKRQLVMLLHERFNHLL